LSYSQIGCPILSGPIQPIRGFSGARASLIVLPPHALLAPPKQRPAFKAVSHIAEPLGAGNILILNGVGKPERPRISSKLDGADVASMTLIERKAWLATILKNATAGSVYTGRRRRSRSFPARDVW